MPKLLNFKLAFIFTVFILVFCITTHGKRSYDYLQLVLQWPHTLYQIDMNNYNSAHKFVEEFKIHGLWPTNFSNRPMNSECDPPQIFDKSLVNGDPQFLPKLEMAWPNLFTGRKDMEFWAYEYEKHGGCGSFPTQNEYFEKTHALWAENNIYKFFEASEIRPGHKKYTLDELERAIQKETQRLPLIRTRKKSGNATEYLLWEVIICYDQVGKNRIDCPLPPAPESSQSKANILYGKRPQTGKTRRKRVGEGSDRKKRKREGKI